MNQAAGNGYTPLLSLFKASTSRKGNNNNTVQLNRKKMALILVHECGATIPSMDPKDKPVKIREWLFERDDDDNDDEGVHVVATLPAEEMVAQRFAEAAQQGRVISLDGVN